LPEASLSVSLFTRTCISAIRRGFDLIVRNAIDLFIQPFALIPPVTYSISLKMPNEGNKLPHQTVEKPPGHRCKYVGDAYPNGPGDPPVTKVVGFKVESRAPNAESEYVIRSAGKNKC
jgi:hypothetical protein